MEKTVFLRNVHILVDKHRDIFLLDFVAAISASLKAAGGVNHFRKVQRVLHMLDVFILKFEDYILVET